MLTKQRKHFEKSPNKSEDLWSPVLPCRHTIHWLHEEEKSTGKSCQPAGNEETRSDYWPEVGTRYFFPKSASAGPLFRNSASASHWSATLKSLVVRQRWSAIPLPLFFCSAPPLVRNAAIPLRLLSMQSTATSPQFRYSATATFTVVHCTLQFTIPQFTVPQYQYQPPFFDNFFSLEYFKKEAK